MHDEARYSSAFTGQNEGPAFLRQLPRSLRWQHSQLCKADKECVYRSTHSDILRRQQTLFEGVCTGWLKSVWLSNAGPRADFCFVTDRLPNLTACFCDRTGCAACCAGGFCPITYCKVVDPIDSTAALQLLLRVLRSPSQKNQRFETPKSCCRRTLTVQHTGEFEPFLSCKRTIGIAWLKGLNAGS